MVPYFDLNIITSLTANDVLNNCYLNSLASYCADYGRDAVTGQVTTLSRGNVNLGRLETEGYNFGVRYRMPETAYGKFAVNLDTNYLATYKSQAEAGAEWANAAGYWNFPRVRATLGLDWSLGSLSANWNLRYYGGFRDYCWDAAAGIECNNPNYQTPNPGWGGGTGSNKGLDLLPGRLCYLAGSVGWQRDRWCPQHLEQAAADHLLDHQQQHRCDRSDARLRPLSVRAVQPALLIIEVA